MRKIIFLDVDGVLNDHTYTEKCAKKLKKLNLSPSLMNFERVPFNPRSLKNLQKIILQTGAEIVLHSTWRLHQGELYVLRARLAEYGIKLNEMTESLSSLTITSHKEEEISKYLEKHIKELGEEIQFVIIDDNDLEMPHLVRTDYRRGLTKKKAEECIEILNKEG